MKSIKLVSILFLSLYSANSMAFEGMYFGAKAGYIRSKLTRHDDINSASFVAGYKFPHKFIAIQGEYSRSLDSATLSDVSGNGDGIWDFETTSLYAVFQFPASRLRSKIGVVEKKLNDSYGDISYRYSQTGLAYGAGYAWNLGALSSIEIELTKLDWDLTYLTLGFYFK